jgi:peptide/nickel transport system ATP-binding protein
MSMPLLEVEGLHTWLRTAQGVVRAVDDVSFSLESGKTLALLGESGCGKSLTALSLMQLLPEAPLARFDGAVRLQGVDLLRQSERALRDVRGRRIGMIFQEPMTSLNPVQTVEQQVGEAIALHRGLRGEALRDSVLQLLRDVRLPDPMQRLHAYPHQLSGGMKQRVMIAIALSAEPEILIADEPTTALDVTIQAQVLQLLRDLQAERGMALLLITHDLGVVADMADTVAVMYAGQFVEVAAREAFFAAPQHPYSQRLFAALPSLSARGQRRLPMLPGQVPSLLHPPEGCRFAARCTEVSEQCQHSPGWHTQVSGTHVRCWLAQAGQSIQTIRRAPDSSASHAVDQRGGNALLQVRDLSVHFRVGSGWRRKSLRAVDGVSLDLKAGETLALVGESGCGKTTLARALLQLPAPTAGSVRLGDTELTSLSPRALRGQRAQLQMIFQDPYSAMNPRMPVSEIVLEGVDSLCGRVPDEERLQRAGTLLTEVGLPADAAQRYPHEFSGGQRQRIAIARALALAPRVLLCDEPTSALDVSVQAQILNLLRDLQERHQLAMLFVTHNLAVVQWLADRVAVMYLGQIVEQGPAEALLTSPLHPYTQALLAAVPQISKRAERSMLHVEGDPPSPLQPPSGCRFHPRCPQASEVCRHEAPLMRQPQGHASAHLVACHLYL